MTDNIGFRWFVIAVALGLSGWALAHFGLDKGLDLAGGVTLTYSVDSSELSQDASLSSDALRGALDETVRVISTRINTLGVRDLGIRREGEDRIVIQAPEMSPQELEEIKQRMTQLGDLRFPILISSDGDLEGRRSRVTKTTPFNDPLPGPNLPIPNRTVFNAEEAAKQLEAARQRGLELAASNNGSVPRKHQRPDGSIEPVYRYGEAFTMKAADGRALPFVWVPHRPLDPASPKATEEEATQRQAALDALTAARSGATDYDEALITGGWVYFDPSFYLASDRLSGEMISSVREGRNDTGARTVVYEVRERSQSDLEDYTSDYKSEPMAIVLNDEIWSAPEINDVLSSSVQISAGGAGGFSQSEAQWLINCLQSGSLKLRPKLESEDSIDPTLGQIAIDRGVLATIIGGLIVVCFMLFFYRFSGMVAVFALVLNLGTMLAVLAIFGATLTLPGIAGIILTIGMAVDASILIFERIREEMTKGKTLVAAVQTGFDRAFVTIIDANLTTVITAILLYSQGVGPIRGFAVTLMAGIACSLFTALFVSRTVFATAIKKNWVTSLSMNRLVPAGLKIDFLSRTQTAVMVSVLLVGGSLAAFFLTGTSKYGLDFTGGTVTRLHFAQEISADEIRDALSGIKDSETGEILFTEVEPTKVNVPADSKFGINGFVPTVTYDIKLQGGRDVTAERLKAPLEGDLKRIFGDAVTAVGMPTAASSGSWQVDLELAPQPGEAAGTTQDRKIERVQNRISSFARQGSGVQPFQTARVDAINADEAGERASKFQLTFSEEALLEGSDELRKDLITAFQDKLPKTAAGEVDLTGAISKSTFLGPNVVADLKKQAIIAIVLALIALVLYIWFRFKDISFGLAAAVAVFHDVIIALGVTVAVNALGIVHVPLSLPIIAGFLTIIGYSLNDTIVLFDRVRENTGNVKGSFRDVINLSINQTLARTLLTSITTFAVVATLFILNFGLESPIEGIAFTLMIGVVVGTYSSIFVASPLVIWAQGRFAKAKAEA